MPKKYDDNGFDSKGIHRDTGTEYDPNGFNVAGYDADGYDSDGFDENGLDREGYDSSGYDTDGYDRDGYDPDGFDRDGIHCDTGTRFNEDGYDCEGNAREYSFDEELEPYGTDVIGRCGWIFPSNWSRLWLAGHEIEMYSDNVDIEDVNSVRYQLDRAYRKATGRNGMRSCIAKHDGSLSEGGFEIATVPFTPEETYAIFESFEVLNGGCEVSAWCHGYEVGHHIHVNATVMSNYTLGKLGVFMNHPKNRDFIERIAQRPSYYNEFENDKKLTRPHNRMRHSVLNVAGATVEFRLFKSNLRTAGILKNYEFAISAIKFSEWAAHSHLTVANYLRYLGMYHKDYRYLVRFIAKYEDGWSRALASAMQRSAWRKVAKAASDDLTVGSGR
jgi:hypothetical protein